MSNVQSPRRPPRTGSSFTLADLAREKRLPLRWLQDDCGLWEQDGGISIPYLAEDGEVMFTRLRNPPGSVRRFHQPKGVDLRPYGLNRLDRARRHGHLYLTEGESDTWTLWHCGLPALGLPGAGAAKSLFAEHVRDLADVYLLPDNDDAGQQFVDGVRARLSELRFPGRLRRLRVPEGHKDVSDWYVACGEPKAFQKQLAAAVQAAELLALDRHPSGSGDKPASLISTPPPALLTTCAADVKMQPLRWLVPDMLPKGKLVLLAGEGGLGKSLITMDLTARLSRGECAFGLEYEPVAGDSLIISCEDDRADTITPRLLAAGADLSHIHFLDGVPGKDGRPDQWTLAYHAALDAHLATHPATHLVTIDPASAFAGMAGIDGHKDAELRALLGPLTETAARYAVTILLVAHIGKSQTSRAVQRVLGSVAWVNAVRAAFIVAERRDDGGRRLLMPVKANLSPRCRPLLYQPVPLSDPEADLALTGQLHLTADDLQEARRQLYRVQWFGPTDADADDVFAAAAQRPESVSDVKRAADWLKQQLRNGPVESSICVDKDNAALDLHKPLKWWRDTILKGELQGKPEKDRTHFHGAWFWSLPSTRDSWTLGILGGSEEGEDMHNPQEIPQESQESGGGRDSWDPAGFTPFE